MLIPLPRLIKKHRDSISCGQRRKRKREKMPKRKSGHGDGHVKSDVGDIGGSTLEKIDEAPVKNIRLERVGRQEADILYMPPLQTQVVDTLDETLLPIQAAGGDSSVVTFHIVGNDYWLNLKDSELVINYEYTNAAGGNLANGKTGNGLSSTRKSYPETQLFHTLWKSVEVRINETEIGSRVQSYPIKAYLDTILSTSEQDQKQLAETILFEKDTQYEKAVDQQENPLDELGAKLIRLTDIMRPTTRYRMVGHLMHFLFKQDKWLPPRTNVEVQLTKANREIYMKSFEDVAQVPQVKIVSMSMNIKKHKLNPKDQEHVEKVMRRYPARFPLTGRKELKYHNIARGSSVYVAQTLFSGVSPTQVIVGFVRGTNFLGNLHGSTLNFEHFNIEEIFFMKNGKKYPTSGYSHLDLGGHAFSNRSALAPYKALKMLGHSLKEPKLLNISYEDFCSKGYTLFVFDFTNNDNEDSEEVFAPVNNAPASMHVTFREPTQESINAVLYSSFDNTLTINQDHQVSFNWL